MEGRAAPPLCYGSRFLVSAAYGGLERRRALALITECFAQDTGVDAAHAWRQWSRAGALVFEIMDAEVRHGPWELTALPEHPGVASKIISQFNEGEATMDPLTLQHVREYSSKSKLRSLSSLAEAAATASILEETTVLIERGWAQLRRTIQVEGQQGHPEALRRSSAERIPNGLRFRHCSWEMQQPADGMGRHAGRRVQQKKAGMTAAGHASARPALKAAQTLRKGSGGKSRAWLAANHLGGKFTRESWVAYRRAMQDHSERARYEQIGRLMRLRGRSNLARKKRRRPDSERPNGWMRSTLRRMREGCKRARQAWDSKAATLQLAEAARRGWAQDWAAAVRKHRARMKQRQEEGFEEAQKLAAHGRRSEPIAKSLFPSQAGALFREPDVAQRMHMWSWVFPVAHRVLERMGRDCRGLSGDRVLEWQRLHTTITAGPKVSRPTRAEQRQAACRAAVVGVDTRAGAEKPTASQVAASLRERLVAFAGIRRESRSRCALEQQSWSRAISSSVALWKRQTRLPSRSGTTCRTVSGHRACSRRSCAFAC